MAGKERCGENLEEGKRRKEERNRPEKAEKEYKTKLMSVRAADSLKEREKAD